MRNIISSPVFLTFKISYEDIVRVSSVHTVIIIFREFGDEFYGLDLVRGKTAVVEGIGNHHLIFCDLNFRGRTVQVSQDDRKDDAYCHCSDTDENSERDPTTLQRDEPC